MVVPVLVRICHEQGNSRTNSGYALISDREEKLARGHVLDDMLVRHKQWSMLAVLKGSVEDESGPGYLTCIRSPADDPRS